MKIDNTGCPQCGEFIADISLSLHESAYCPRCKYRLAAFIEHQPQKIIALSLTGLMLFAFLMVFPFMEINFNGLTHEIYITDTVKQLVFFEHPFVALFFFMGVLALPFMFFLGALVLFSRISVSTLSQRHRWLCRLLFSSRDWLLADVFLVGVLVSLVKIGALGQITLHVGFYAFSALILCLAMIYLVMEKGSTWQYFPYREKYGRGKRNRICKQCHALGDENERCLRCDTKIKPLKFHHMLQTCWAYLLTAFLLYIPANLLPIMITRAPGHSKRSTILEGVSLLWDLHSYAIALTILVASFMIPLAKMGVLCTLYYQAGKSRVRPRWLIQKQTFWLHVTHLIGRWSFIDVFVVALLVALVQLKQVATIVPGQALLLFTGVVILTLFSAQAFDARALWRHDQACAS